MTESRQKEVTAIVTKFFNDFSRELSDSAAQDSIRSTCSPDILWCDHGFHNQRTGHDALLGLRKAFLHCNQPFETRIKALHPTPTGVVAEVIWVGCCKNDIVRPNGHVAVKANGRNFVHHVCFVMEVDVTHGITRIDEYYNKPWWDGVSEEEYTKLTGASLKS